MTQLEIMPDLRPKTTSSKEEKIHIAIYAISSVYGGVEVLVSRLCKYLKDNNIEFVLIAKEKTRISEELNWAKQISLEQLPLHSQTITHLFFPSVTFVRNEFPWDSLLHAKLLCWIVHPTSIFTAFFPGSHELLGKIGFSLGQLIKFCFYSHYRITSNFFCKILKKNALISMDGANTRCLHYFYPATTRYNCPVVPIPISLDIIENPKKRRQTQKTIDIGYFGRLIGFKLSAIDSFFKENIAYLSKKYSSINLHIIAEGDSIPELEKLCERLGIRLHRHNFLENSAAKKIISEETDFAICMGTAALDIASTGHPCILIDPSHQNNKKTQKYYRFVHEIEEYTLGEYRDFPKYKQGLHRLPEMLASMESNSKIGQQGANYTRAKHNPNLIFAVLVKHLIESKLTVREIKPIILSLRSSEEKAKNRLEALRKNSLIKKISRAL